ncbi:MAG: nucleoside recognition domain-containing protein [Bacteroidota bacterium]|jgi:spore maturation protein SpmA/spore maturation protein SpmB
MALNIVWIAFFIVAFVIALYKFLFLHDTEVFKTLVDGMFDSAKGSVMDVAFPLAGTMVFFLGLMNIAERAGAINWIARLLNPFMKRLFPEVPEKHPAMGQMVMNFSANMLGLDNAATPFGLKAMESLQSINPDKEKATNAQIMFLVLHTSGLTLIPLTIISYRLAAGSTEAASVFIPCVLATICTTLASIFIVGFKQKLKWDKVILTWLLGLVALVAGMLFFVQQMGAEQKEVFSRVTGNMILLLLVVLIIIGGMLKKINVFDAFIDGAKGGFDVILKIIPYLVGMLVAIRVFRDSGALGYMVDGLSWVIGLTGVDTAFTPALPVAIMKPFSGSGARGLMIDVMKSNGPDSFVGKLASTFQGSADTTFYIIALYFGSVGIKKVRYAIWAGVLADLIGVVAAILIGYVFFM